MSSSISRLQALRYRWDFADPSAVTGKASAEGIALLSAIRKRHLASSVRIVPNVMPGLSDACAAALARMDLDVQPDGYVFASREIQAFCVSCGIDQTPVLCMSAGLVDLLAPAELAFVIGHEIGHFVMGHGACALDPQELEDEDAVNALAHQRAKEISADRVGLVACGGSNEASRAILKTATGLSERYLRFDTAAYLDQARELVQMGGTLDEMHATHPMFAVRLRALLWFEMSDLWATWKGEAPRGTLNADQLDNRIERDLVGVSGFSMADQRDFDLRRATVWAVACTFAKDGVLTRVEQEALKVSFGAETASDVVGYVKSYGLEEARGKLREALSRIRRLPSDMRRQWLRDLARCLSDALPADSREQALRSFAEQMGLVQME